MRNFIDSTFKNRESLSNPLTEYLTSPQEVHRASVFYKVLCSSIGDSCNNIKLIW